MGDQTKDEKPDELTAWLSHLGSAVGQLPGDFGELLARLERGRTELRVELARAIQPRFNAYVKTLPQETFAEKAALASWINHVMRVLDLALRSPKSGEPSVLIAENAYKEHPKPRFRFQGKGVTGRLHRSNPSYELPELELIPAPLREEGIARWSERNAAYRGRREDRER